MSSTLFILKRLDYLLLISMHDMKSQAYNLIVKYSWIQTCHKGQRAGRGDVGLSLLFCSTSSVGFFIFSPTTLMGLIYIFNSNYTLCSLPH